MIRLRPSVLTSHFITTLEESPSEANILEWTEKRLREIERRYIGAIHDSQNIERIRAEMIQVAMVVESITGEKPTWSVSIERHQNFMLFSDDPRWSAPILPPVQLDSDAED